jgi:hypothetical protein
MAEPISSASNAPDVPEDETSQALPNNAEDRKAAAALNALNANAMSQENGESATKQPSAADQEALGKAMSRLEIASGLAKKTDSAKKPEQKKETEVKKKVKVTSEDVTFLVSLHCLSRCLRSILTDPQVEELDLSKTKATELLRSYNGDAVKAVKAFITPAIRAS